MQGRLENELKLLQSTETVINKLPDFVREWFVNMQASRLTGATCRDYATKINRFFEYINEDVKSIQPKDITLQVCESYIISCQTKKNDDGMIIITSDSYQNTVWFALNNLLSFLEKRKYIEENYMKYISRPKNRDLTRITNERVLLTQKEFKQILNAAKKSDHYKLVKLNNRDVLMLMIFMTTGIRETALASLNVNDIDDKEKTLTVIDKGNKTHIYPLSDSVIEYYHLWINDKNNIFEEQNNALFVNYTNKRISKEYVSNLVKRYCLEGIGIELSPHKLRSGFCSILYDKTHDIEFVRKVVGHSSINTTRRYIKTKGDERNKAMQIMDSVLKI